MSVIAELAEGGSKGLFSGIGEMAKSLREAFVGKEMTPELQVQLQQKAMDLELAVTNAQMEMITAEAKSSDPWTSRARPAFAYVFYILLIVCGIVAPVIGVFYPEHMKLFFENMSAGFRAIPTDLYTLFGFGYLGYVGARSWDKKNGVAR